MGKHFIHNLKDGFWAYLLISVNPIEFGRIAFKYFLNEVNQLMINANISITDYFSLIESYPGLGNAYLSNLKNTLMNMGYTAAGWTYLADEHHIYGSSRVGVHNTHFVLAKRFSTADMEYTQKTGNQVHFIRGKRNYELSNHLGNVQVVISDKRISVCDNELQTERFEADILMSTDYYPFGMAIPERQWYTGSDSSNYRFGFNGMEKDNEAKGPGNSLDFGARIYDSRLGRWLSVDPEYYRGHSWSSYNSSFNNPVIFVDKDGKWPIPVVTALIGGFGNALYGLIKGDDGNKILDRFIAGAAAGFVVGLAPAAVVSIVTGEGIMAGTVATFTGIVGGSGAVQTGLVLGVFGNGIENIVEQGIGLLRGEKKEFSEHEVSLNMATGMIEGIIGVAGDAIAEVVGGIVNKSLKEAMKGMTREQERLLKDQIKGMIQEEAKKKGIKFTKKELKTAVNKGLEILKESEEESLKLTVTRATNGTIIVSTIVSGALEEAGSAEGEDYIKGNQENENEPKEDIEE